MRIFTVFRLTQFRVIKSTRWAGNVARMEEGRIAFKILTDKRHR